MFNIERGAMSSQDSDTNSRNTLDQGWRRFGRMLMVVPVLSWLASSVWTWCGPESYTHYKGGDLFAILAATLIMVMIIYFPAFIIGYLLYLKRNLWTIGMGLLITPLFILMTVLLFSGLLDVGWITTPPQPEFSVPDLPPDFTF